MARKEYLRQDQVDRQFGTAGQERDHGNGQLLITVRGKYSGGQDRGDAAAEAGDQRQDGFAAKADLVHGTIQDPCHPIHIATVFQQGQEEKQSRNSR